MAGLVATFGSGAMTNSISDIDQADVIFVIGSNTTEQHPLIGSRVVKAAVRSGAPADRRRSAASGLPATPTSICATGPAPTWPCSTA